MKHYISINNEQKTGGMTVFEAVEAFRDFKALATENDKVEINSITNLWAIKENGKINQRLIFDSEEKADEKFWLLKPLHFDKKIEIVPVREFIIWYRIRDDKDFHKFYTDSTNLENAVDEAINHLKIHDFIELENVTVARNSINYIRNPERKR